MQNHKVLLSAYACFDNFGSEPGVGYRWLTSILGKDHKVTLATSGWSYLNLSKESKHLLNDPNLEVIIIGTCSGDSFFRKNRIVYQIYLIWWQMRLYRSLLRKKIFFDVVHHITYGGVSIPSFVGRFGKTSIYGPVGGAEWAPIKLSFLCGPRAVIKEIFQKIRLFVLRLDPFVIYTKYSYTRILLKNKQNMEFYGSASSKCEVKSEISISSEIINCQMINEGIKKPQNRVVFAGRAICWKGGSIAIKVVKYIREILGRTDIVLEFYGYGSEIGRWKKEANNCDYITFTERLPQSKFLEKISNASCVIFPSYHDSSGNVILESLCKGIPAVAFDLGGPSSILKHKNLLVDPNLTTRQIIREFALKVVAGVDMSLEEKVNISNFYMDRYSRENLLKGVYE